VRKPGEYFWGKLLCFASVVIALLAVYQKPYTEKWTLTTDKIIERQYEDGGTLLAYTVNRVTDGKNAKKTIVVYPDKVNIHLDVKTGGNNWIEIEGKNTILKGKIPLDIILHVSSRNDIIVGR